MVSAGESSSNGMPLPKTREQLEAQRWIKRLVDLADNDPQQLTQLLQRQGKQAVLQAQQYADSLRGDTDTLLGFGSIGSK